MAVLAVEPERVGSGDTLAARGWGVYDLQTSGVTSSASTMSEAPESKSTRTSVRPMFSHV